MSQIFSEAWMLALKDAWNETPEIYEPLQQAGFSAIIGYGFKGEPRSRGLLCVLNGKVEFAGVMDGEELDWDLRASPEKWAEWIEHGFGLHTLGSAIATNSLVFAAGNYRKMIGDLSLSKPFLLHFQLMEKI